MKKGALFCFFGPRARRKRDWFLFFIFRGWDTGVCVCVCVCVYLECIA